MIHLWRHMFGVCGKNWIGRCWLLLRHLDVTLENRIAAQLVFLGNMGLSENRLNPYTQWFCWSLSLLNGYFIGNIPYFQTNPYVQVMLILSGCLLPEPLGKSSLWWISLQLEVKQSSPCATDWCSKATQTSGINISIISFLKYSYCFDTDSFVCLEMMSICIGPSDAWRPQSVSPPAWRALRQGERRGARWRLMMHKARWVHGSFPQ